MLGKISFGSNARRVGDRVVVTHYRAYGPYTSYYCIGNFNAEGTDIQWVILGIASCLICMVLLRHQTEWQLMSKVAGRGWTCIVCRVGQFQGNTIQFATENPF